MQLQSRRGRAGAQRLEVGVTAEQKTIEEHKQLELSVRDSEMFVDALLNSRPVNDRMRGTVRRYREATGF